MRNRIIQSSVSCRTSVVEISGRGTNIEVRVIISIDRLVIYEYFLDRN